ncbi:ABC transporter C-terminal domain-containing protein, partial [Streptomyces sp. NPDC059071]
DSAAYRAARKELAKLERALEKLTEREAKLHAALAEAATEPDKLVKLGTELKQVQAEKESTEERWFELAEG